MNTQNFQNLPPPLGTAFYDRDTRLVAQDLLGCLLWRRQGGLWRSWRIVETEAYTQDDPACHAYQRKKGRAAMLYAEPGTAYVYMTYGMYHCLNAVTEPLDTAGAVLIRALEPDADVAQGAAQHPKDFSAELRTNGPGRLARALDITRDACNGQLLTTPEHGLFFSAGPPVPEALKITTTRIGISKGTELPWRYYELGNPWVSVRNRQAESEKQAL
jgi:DNA-3-methyladenine glycosylase